mmetsp:Transcript_46157/g.61108  ORF Transcript_46157/g.61108 Transcript_46157/m.61108 type:complete len:90 (+) Transcript_46157:25-294(+)
MCTLEPLGFQQSQFFTIPFLVLIKAIDQNSYSPSESLTNAIEHITLTCSQIIAQSHSLRAQIVEMAQNFTASPASRTADVVSDLLVLTA